MPGKVLIYGGSGSIGSATARLLSQRGYQIHLVGRNEQRLSSVADEVDASYTVGDINEPDLFDRVASEVGDSLDGLIYAVGTINLASLNRLKAQDFLNDFSINAMGAALAVQSCLPLLKKGNKPSSIVLFSSIAAQQGFPFHASVGMAKGAVSGLTVSLAAELAPRIRVNAIAPSLTQTDLAASILSNEKMAASIASLHAMKRLGTPEDIAKMAAFLISPDSDWITGQIIGIDGGRSSVRTES